MKSRIQLYHLVVGGVILVFLCNMAISYYHAWEMYSSIGDFPHLLAHVAVVAFDTVFALATLVVSIGTLKKIDLGVRVWIAFVFGFVITTWSNVRASMGSEWIHFVTLQWGKISSTGWESLVAGLSTPAALVAIELLLSWMVTHREKFTSTSADGGAGDTTTSETGATRKTGGEITTTNTTTNDTTSTSNTSTTTTSTSKAGEAGDAEKTEAINDGDNTTTSDTSTAGYGDTTSDEGTSETGEAGDTTIKTGDTNSTSSTSSTSSTTTSNATSSTSQTGDTTSATSTTTRKTGATRKAGGEKKKRHLRLVKNNDPELERVKKVALDHFKEHGEWPGRPTLMEKADCRENVARRALRDLKEEQEKVERGA